VRLHDVDVVASGGPDGYRGDVRASGSVWQLSDAICFVRASGNTSAAHADSLDVKTLGGVVQGSGFVRWTPGLSWKARVHGDSVRAGDLFGASDWLGPVSFRASGTGLVHDDSMQIATDVQSLEGTLRKRPLAARAHVDVDRQGVEASNAWVKWGSSQATFSGRMADVATLHIDATVPALGEILPHARGAVSLRATLAGSPSQIDVNADVRGRRVRAAGFNIPDLDATLKAAVAAEKYVPHGADVHSATIRIGESRIDTRGSVSWRDGIEWKGSVAADRFEVSTLAPARWNLHGPLSLRATTEGAKRGRHLSARLVLESLSGMLRERAVSGSGSIALKDGEADLSALALEWGDARLSAHGHAGRTMNLEFDAAAPNLAPIDSSLNGGVTLRGAVTGAQKKPRVNVDITADSLRMGEYAVGRLEGHVDADLSFSSPADVHLLALRASRGASEADTVRVDVTGPRSDLHASVAAVKGIRHAALALRGALADTTWSGWIEDVNVRPDSATAEWRSRGRAPLFVSRSRVRVDSLVIAHGDARISAHAAWQRGDTTHAELDVRGFELSTFQRYLGETSITGTLNGSAVATIDPSGRIVARVDFVPGPGEIIQAGRHVGYEGRIAGRADRTGLSAHVDLALKEKSVGLATVNAKLSIPGFVAGRDSLGAQPIEGALDLDCPNIAPVLSLIDPSWSKSSGALTAHVTPLGTAADFKLSGRLALENGSLNLPSGLRLRRTRLVLVSDGDGSISLDGEVTSGGGRVVLKASSARSEHGWVNGTFTAKGERFQAVNQPDAQVFVSPDVEVKLEQRVATVTGKVGVPYARIETAEVPASAASQSKDVVFVEDSLAAKPKLQVRTMLRVELGDSVTFNGFGLRARLAGSLAIDDERGRPTQGTGEIQIVNGKYRAFGNELTIDPGRFIFGGGPIDNPGLDIRAYRGLTTQNVMASSGEMVGMKLFGTLRKPEFTVFSNPPMSQSEIMSYLVTGRPMSTSGDQSALANAAMLIGMQKGGNAVGGIGKKFSLDEAYLEGGQDVKETAFVAGKYLSPKLYVSYATGLFENVNTFRARYSLTNKWTLQTESGKESGTDLLYWFERGK
jgi:translocation and assembly module TamB